MMDPPYNGPKMEARRSSDSSVVEVPRELDLDKGARVYGSRWVRVETAGGGARLQEVPLFWEDLFDPQEGDHVPHGKEHSDVISDTKGILEAFFDAQGRNDVLVWDDGKMFWADPKLPKISPDLAVVFGIGDPKGPRDSFNESREGTRPSFVLEVTSNATAHFDRGEKPDIYRRAKVRECLLVDRLKSPWTLSGNRLDAKGRWREIRPDKRGRYLAKTLGVCFSIAEGGKGLVLQDAATDEILLNPLEVSRERGREAEARKAAERKAAEEAEARRREAEAHQAEIQKLMAEIERLKPSAGRAGSP